MFRVKLMHKDNRLIAICKIYYVLFFEGAKNILENVLSDPYFFAVLRPKQGYFLT